MSFIDFPALVDNFPDLDASAGDKLNTMGKEHDDLHNKLKNALIAVERITVGPTHYNVGAYPQVTFDQRWAAALAEAESAGGNLVVAPGAYTSNGLATISKPHKVGILGPGGAEATVITRTGGAAVLTIAPAPLGVAQLAAIKGIKLVGDATAGIKAVRCIDTGVMPHFEDVVISNFSGAGSIAVSVENSAIWNERGSCDRLHLDHNAIGLRFLGAGPSNSHFYGRWKDLRLNIGAGQIGIQVAGTALLQGGKFVIVANIDGTGGIVIDMADTAVWGGEVFLTGEQTTGTGGIIRRMGSGALWAADGKIDVNGCADSGTLANIWSPFEKFGTHHSVLFPAVPSVAIGGAAGTSPPAPTIQGNDTRLLVACGTGTAPAAGNLLNVTYQTPYAFIPYPVITPFGVSAATLRPFVSAFSATGFSINVADVPPTSAAAGSIAFIVRITG